ncbi:MAG: 2-C-methyl-D-erythritol 4-phosphate cytidylyltransferase [Lentisphaerae bacterium]|nr:2-C-methyl-D-erythritol 4-phosphate cytidylyltransferase [Lentisphaerota bacterium]
MNAAVIVAAGRNSPMGSHVDRAFLSLGTRPVLAYSMIAFEKCADIDIVVVVVRKDRVDAAQAVAQMFGCSKVKKIVGGGTHRMGSVQAGLDELSDEINFVTVHDASRPCVTPDLITETIKSAKRYGSGVAAVRAEDGIKEVLKGQTVTKSHDRTKIWHALTPQSYRLELLRNGLELARKKPVIVADDSEAVALTGEDVHLVTATVPNIKITSADDLTLAAAVLRL